MRVVLDTNVVISGIFFSGPPYQVLNSWRHGSFQLVLSGAIFDEYERVARELHKQFPGVDTSGVLRLLALGSLWVDAPELGEQVSEDPEDDKFLACALAAAARIIVSGDKHLLRVSGYKGVQVVKPKVFLEAHLNV